MAKKINALVFRTRLMLSHSRNRTQLLRPERCLPEDPRMEPSPFLKGVFDKD
jgi:hypothetical protein